MSTLKQYQAAAEHAAKKMGLEEPIAVRWMDILCSAHSKLTLAHCHVDNGKMPRGTICVRRRTTWPNGIYDLMTHEVAHLVARTHGSKRMLAAIAKANPKGGEAKMARRIGAVPHRHRWAPHRLENINSSGVHIQESCDACGSTRIATYVRA